MKGRTRSTYAFGFVAYTRKSGIAEDFSRYLKLAPGALFRIGTGGGFDNHYPSFTADPSALLPTARFFATLAERKLAHLANNRGLIL